MQANSVEARLPFLDHELVELVNHMPSSVKINQSISKSGVPELTEKWILKEAAKPFITEEIYNRQKHPFLAPPALFHPDSKLMEWALGNIYSPAMMQIGWIDGPKVRAYVDHAVSTVKKAHASPGGIEAAINSNQILLPDLLRWDCQILILASMASLHRQFKMN